MHNGSEFANSVMSELIALLGIKESFISPYNSQGNGKAENIHKRVARMIRSYINEQRDDWDDLLPLLEFAINTMRSEVTKYTPFFLHFGRHPVYPLDTVHGGVYKPPLITDQYVKMLQQQRDEVFDWVKKYKEKAAKDQTERYNCIHDHTIGKFNIGDYIILKNNGKQEGQNKKLHLLYNRETYQVIEDLDNGSYVIVDLKDQQRKTTNMKQMKKAFLRYKITYIAENKTMNGKTIISEENDKTKEDNELSTTEMKDTELDNERDEQWEITKIIDKRTHKGALQYKVHYKGYAQRYDQWVHESDIDAPELVIEFEEQHNKIQTRQR